MHEELKQLDPKLAALACSLRDGDYMLACVQLGELALELDHYICREERALELAYRAMEGRARKAFVTMRGEHRCLRDLVAAIASALDRAERERAADIVGKLRSVLLFHVTKEEQLLAAPSSTAVH